MVHQRYKQQNNKGVYIQCICSSMLLSVWKQFNFSLSKDLLSYNIHFPGFYYSNWEVLLGKWCNTIGDTHRHGFTEDPESFRYQALAGSQINSINKKRNKSVCVGGRFNEQLLQVFLTCRLLLLRHYSWFDIELMGTLHTMCRGELFPYAKYLPPPPAGHWQACLDYRNIEKCNHYSATLKSLWNNFFHLPTLYPIHWDTIRQTRANSWSVVTNGQWIIKWYNYLSKKYGLPHLTDVN